MCEPHQPASLSECRQHSATFSRRFLRLHQWPCKSAQLKTLPGSVVACPAQSGETRLSRPENAVRSEQGLNLSGLLLWRLSYNFFLSYALLCYAGLSLGCQMVYQWYPFGCQLVYQGLLKYNACSHFLLTARVHFETQLVCICHCVNCCWLSNR